MRRLIWNAGTVSLIVGIGGGLLLGWILSRAGQGWLAPLPWLIYLAAVIVFAVALSLLWPAPARHGTNAASEAIATPDTAGSKG